MKVMFRIPEVHNKGKLFSYAFVLITWKQTKIKFFSWRVTNKSLFYSSFCLWPISCHF